MSGRLDFVAGIWKDDFAFFFARKIMSDMSDALIS